MTARCLPPLLSRTFCEMTEQSSGKLYTAVPTYWPRTTASPPMILAERTAPTPVMKCCLAFPAGHSCIRRRRRRGTGSLDTSVGGNFKGCVQILILLVVTSW